MCAVRRLTATRSTRAVARDHRIESEILQLCGRRTMGGHHSIEVAFASADGGLVGTAKPSGGRDNRVEDRLQLGRRARNHPQDLRGRGLLLPRHYELTLQFFHDPDCRHFGWHADNSTHWIFGEIPCNR
jgi:hypothetical protein